MPNLNESTREDALRYSPEYVADCIKTILHMLDKPTRGTCRRGHEDCAIPGRLGGRCEYVERLNYWVKIVCARARSEEGRDGQ